MFNFIKKTLHNIYTQFTAKIGSLFGKSTIDEAALKELEIVLLSSDAGVKTTQAILSKVRAAGVTEGKQLHQALHTILLDILKSAPNNLQTSRVYLLVGINGSGKTTFAGKLAYHFKKQGKKVLLVAADTFRAAALQQLHSWANQTGTDMVSGNPGQDPAAVVFAGCEAFIKGDYDILIIDTAGRLHTKTNLMNELGKVMRIISKKLPHESIQTLLTVDSMLGQNSFEQAKLFKECAHVNGIVLTKMDGTAKGGIVFAIVSELHIPILYITFGEQLDHLKPFNADQYVDQLLDTV